jgi:ferredoxin
MATQYKEHEESNTEQATYNVEFISPKGRHECVQVPADRHILEVAREEGLELPSLCEQGWCCTCAVRVLEGTIDQSDSRRFYEQDRQAGFGLICTGKPRSDLKLQTHALPAMRAHRLAKHLPVPRGTTLPEEE